MHDCKGRPLSVGDTVLVPFVIKSVSEDSGFCNVTVETTATMPGNSTKSTLTLNSQQTIRANDGDSTDFYAVTVGAVTRIS